MAINRYPIETVICHDYISDVSVSVDASVAGTLLSVSNIEAASHAPTTTSETPTLELSLIYVGTSSGVTTAVTRPTGTASGNRLYLMVAFPSSAASAPALTGWTLNSGLDTSGSYKYAIYKRIADLTATDTPTIGIPVTGWVCAAMAATTESVATTLLAWTGITTIPGLSVTTVAASSMVINMIISPTATTLVTSTPNGFVFRYTTITSSVNFGVATKWMNSTGVSGVPTWTESAANSGLIYAVAATA